MVKLTLPEPAGDLWLQTRDILTRLGPAGNPWAVHLGGGTVLGARLHHRESTDIDIVVHEVPALGALARPGPENLTTRLGGTTIKETQGQIRVRMKTGVIDVNTAPVIPEDDHEEAEIEGRPQTVLSTVQILRGKFERATEPAPVRDVYDVIRAAADADAAGSLAAAYGLLIEDRQDAIETEWRMLDALYEQEAGDELRLTEEPRADPAMLGSAGALALNSHRLARLVVSLEGDEIEIARTTRNGKVFTDSTSQATVGRLMNRLGVKMHMAEHNATQGRVERRIEEHVRNRRNGVVFDTSDSHPERRLDGRNASMKRADAPTARE